MDIKSILNWCLENLDDINIKQSWGETSVFYNPNNKFKNGTYILTIKQKDGENDVSSRLNRENTYRLNLGVSKNTFINLFGEIPKRASAGNIVNMNYDFSEYDKIMPHPIYAWMKWICVLNPSKETFDNLKKYVYESYEISKEKFYKRKK